VRAASRKSPVVGGTTWSVRLVNISTGEVIWESRPPSSAMPSIVEMSGATGVYTLVRQLGGTMAVLGAEGTGTIVRIRLPLLAGSGFVRP